MPLPKQYQFVLTLIISALLSLLPSLWSRARAGGIFTTAQNAMTCIIKSASAGGATNTILSSLPTAIFSAIALFLFVYFLGSTFQLVQAVRAGEEVTHLIIPIVSGVMGVIFITFFQNVLFGAGGGC